MHLYLTLINLYLSKYQGRNIHEHEISKEILPNLQILLDLFFNPYFKILFYDSFVQIYKPSQKAKPGNTT